MSTDEWSVSTWGGITHCFIHPLPQDGHDEESPDRGAEITLHGLDVVEELPPLRGAHHRDPQDGDTTHQENKQSGRSQSKVMGRINFK